MSKKASLYRILAFMLCLAVFAAFMPVSALAEVLMGETPNPIYVSKEANASDDNGTGAIDAPYATISKGVSMLQDGQTIYIKEGTYTEEVELKGKKNVKIIGEGKVVAAFVGQVGKGMITVADCSNVEIRNITTNADRGNISSTDYFSLSITGSTGVEVSGCTFRSTARGACGINMLGTTASSIHNNSFDTLRGHGLLLNGSSNNRIYNNLFNGVERGISLYNASNNNTIVFNSFKSHSVSDLFYYNATQSGNIIKNNIFSSTGKIVRSLNQRTDIAQFMSGNVFSNNVFNIADENTVLATDLTTNLTYAQLVEAGSITASKVADPLYLPGTSFEIAGNSPCAKAGMVIEGITTDYAGATRQDPPSIGAYEPSGEMLVDTYYVSATEGNDSNIGDEAHPFKTIQAGINALSDGKTLIIKAGTYHFSADTGAADFLSIKDKTFTEGISIIGETGAIVRTNIAGTKVPSTGSGKNATLGIVNSSNIKLSGIIFEGADYKPSGVWDHICLEGSSNIKIENCTFTGNSRVSGIVVKSSASTICGNQFSTLRDHTIQLFTSSGNVIYNNLLNGKERGIALYSGSANNEVYNNTFANNAAGDIVYYNGLSGDNIFINNLFSGIINEINSGKNNTPIDTFISKNVFEYNLFNYSTADTVVAKSVYEENDTLTYTQAREKGYFENSILAPAKFENGYQLAKDSPCIDAGKAIDFIKTDLLGKKRDIPDIGAYENVESFSPFAIVYAAPEGDNVKLNESIQIDFTEKVDKNSITGIEMIEGAGSVVPAQINVFGETVVLTGYTLKNSTEYTVKVPAGVRDVNGNVLKESYSWKFKTQAASELKKNSLQVGGPGSTKAFGKKVITPVSGDFYIQFDYMYPEGQAMSGFYFFSSYDGSVYKDPVITHTGDNLTFKSADASYSLANGIRPGKWYNMTLHFTDDSYLEIFIDGIKQAFNNGSTKIKITANQQFTDIGYIGDTSNADYNGTAYYDNFKVTKEGKVIFEESFDKGEEVKWDVVAFNPPGIFGLSTGKYNSEAAELVEIEAKGENGRTGFVIGDSGKIIVSGKLSNGKNAVLGLGKVNIEDPKGFVELSNNRDGTYTLRAKAKGETTLEVDVVSGSKIFSTTLPVVVTEVPEIYGIAFEQAKADIIMGASRETGLYMLSTDGSRAASDLNFEKVEITSDSPAIATAEKKDGKISIAGISPGSTNIKIAVASGGKQYTASIAVNVLTIHEIESRVRRSVIFPGDKERVIVTAFSSTGEVISNELLSINSSSSDPTVAEVDENGYIVAGDIGEATITTTVSLQGTTLQVALEIDVQELTTSKTRRSYYTDEKLANAAENIEKYSWAKDTVSSAVQLADSYLALGHDFLWSSITSQRIPRSYAAASKESWGCLECGEKLLAFGNYPYSADPINNPWKLICPSCKKQFPTNDFESYYKGGLDADGFFDPVLAKQHNDALIAKGEKGNLVNILYPEKGESWGVDDGTGHIDEQGRKFTFVAYYNHWKLWYGGLISSALNAFRDAYLYTGDVKYADAGVVMLDRIADVYPEMNLDIWRFENGYLNSNGNSNRGKVVGSIWETGLAEYFMLAYDAFYPALADNAENPVSEEVLNYLSAKPAGAGKGSVKRIRRNIEDGILRQIYPAVKRSEIRGNSGMHQSTLAIAAVVMDSNPETKEWLEFNFKSGTTTAYEVTGGNIYAALVNDVDRDGHGNEGAPGYNSLWLSQYLNVAKALEGYSIEGMDSVDLFENVKFQRMFHAMYPLIVSDIFTPTIGDTAMAGNPYIAEKLSNMVTAYQKFRDPVFAQAAYLLNGNSTKNIKLGIFDKDPEGIALDIQKVIDTQGMLELGGTNATGFGFAALRDGEPGEKLEITGTEIEFNSMNILEASKPTKYFDSNGTLQFEADIAGDSIEFEFNVEEDIETNMYINMWTASTYGIYEVSINGLKTGEISFQGSGMAVRKAGKVELKKGANTVKFVLTDKPGGKKAGFRQLVLSDSLDKPLEETTQRDIWMYYGRTYNKASHGHKDALNLGLHAFNIDLMPDLGYPRYANEEDKHRRSLVSNTISHNTVVVNGKQQDGQIVGQPLHFDQGGLVKMVDVNSRTAYSQTDMYRRTSAMIRVDEKNSYVVDLFRIKGGDSHMYSFHGADDNGIVTEGLNLVKQADAGGNYVGTYAGKDIAYSKEVADATGFSYFFNVDKQVGSIGNFSVDYSILDTWNTKGQGNGMPTDIHLKLTLLGDFNEVALSEAEPPENKVGNPATLKYVFAKRTGTNLSSCFTSIIEPYSGESFIEKSEALTVKEGDSIAKDIDVRAVKVTLKNGRVDYIVNAVDNTKTYTVVDGDTEFDFKGFIGVYSKLGDQVLYYMNDGEVIAEKSFENAGAVTGSVVDFTKELSTDNRIVVKTDVEGINPEELAGKYIYIENDGIHNAAYKIVSAAVTGENITLDTGNVSPVRAYKNNGDFSQGFVYDIEAGRKFSIPLSAVEGTNVAMDKSGLAGAIAAAQGKYDAAVVGSSYGQYPQAAKDELKEAIDKASAVMQDMFASPDDVENAVNMLDSAVKVFESKVIRDTPDSEDVEDTPVTDTKDVKKPEDVLKEGIIQVDPGNVTVKDGTAYAKLSNDIIKKGLDYAKGNNLDKIVVEVPSKGSKTLEASIPVSAFILSGDSGIKALVIKSDLAEVSIRTSALKDIPSDGSGEFRIAVSLEDKAGIDPDTAVKVGDGPIYALNAYVGSKRMDEFSEGKSLKAAFKYALKEGEEAGKVVVCRINDRGDLEVVKNCIYNKETGEITFLTSYSGKYTVKYSNAGFEDLGNVSWARASIEGLAAREVVQGVGANSFAPEGKVTRAEFLQMVMSAFDITDEQSSGSFKDVKETDWFYKAVMSARSLGIVEGVNSGEFAPHREITREEMAVIAYRASVKAGIELGRTVDTAKFNDEGDIYGYARESVQKMQEAGIINGMGDGSFAPKENATRAQAAVIAYAMMGRLF